MKFLGPPMYEFKVDRKKVITNGSFDFEEIVISKKFYGGGKLLDVWSMDVKSAAALYHNIGQRLNPEDNE